MAPPSTTPVAPNTAGPTSAPEPTGQAEPSRNPSYRQPPRMITTEDLKRDEIPYPVPPGQTDR